MGFQTSVNLQQAAAVEGDFASANPRASYVAGEGNLVAGTSGVTVGRFAWVANGVASNAGTGKPSGFVHREQGVALITTYLDETSLTIPRGFGVTLQITGDYFAKNTAAVASLGNKVFASLTTGEIQTGAAGSTVVGFVETDFTVVGFPHGGTGAVGELIKIGRPA